MGESESAIVKFNSEDPEGDRDGEGDGDGDIVWDGVAGSVIFVGRCDGDDVVEGG